MRFPDALADREAGPHPLWSDYATHEEYAAAFFRWRAIRRDAYLTAAEQDAVLGAFAWKLGLGEEYRP